MLSGLGIECVLSGDKSIGTRPMNRVLKPLRLMGANIRGIDDNYTPLVIEPASIKGITYQMEVASAQVKSAILLASLFANDTTTITELDISRNHTETMFEHYNIPITVDGKTIKLEPNALQNIKARDFNVPGDISSADSLLSPH